MSRSPKSSTALYGAIAVWVAAGVLILSMVARGARAETLVFRPVQFSLLSKDGQPVPDYWWQYRVVKLETVVKDVKTKVGRTGPQGKVDFASESLSFSWWENTPDLGLRVRPIGYSTPSAERLPVQLTFENAGRDCSYEAQPLEGSDANEVSAAQVDCEAGETLSEIESLLRLSKTVTHYDAVDRNWLRWVLEDGLTEIQGAVNAAVSAGDAGAALVDGTWVRDYRGSPYVLTSEWVRRSFEKSKRTISREFSAFPQLPEPTELPELNAEHSETHVPRLYLEHDFSASRPLIADADYRTTLLMVAAAHASLDVVKALVLAGADPLKRDLTLCDPIMIAAGRGDKEIVTFFLEHNTAPQGKYRRNGAGFNAMDIASAKGHTDVVELLGSYGFSTAVGVSDFLIESFGVFSPGSALRSRGQRPYCDVDSQNLLIEANSGRESPASEPVQVR